MVGSLYSLFFPDYCMGCGEPLTKGEEILCTFCLFHLPRTYFHQDPGNPAARVFWGRVRLEMAASFVFFHKGGNVQEMLHQLKYQGKKEIGHFLGELYAYELGDAVQFRDVEVIIPVPLHPKKLRKRGYNQSQCFAEGLSKVWKVPVETDCLYRKLHTATQTRKSRYERWENVEDIFGIRNEDKISGKHILLVDDVNDTGDTLKLVRDYFADADASSFRIAVLHHKNSSSVDPDFYARRIIKWRWIIYPWAVFEDVSGFLDRLSVKPADAEEAVGLLEKHYGLHVRREMVEEILAAGSENDSRDKDK